MQIDSLLEPGEFLDFTYLAKNMASSSGDVTFEFWLERNGQKIVSGSDVLFIGSSEEKIESTSLHLPSDLKEGIYQCYIKLTFGGYEVILGVIKGGKLHLVENVDLPPERQGVYQTEVTPIDTNNQPRSRLGNAVLKLPNGKKIRSDNDKYPILADFVEKNWYTPDKIKAKRKCPPPVGEIDKDKSFVTPSGQIVTVYKDGSKVIQQPATKNQPMPLKTTTCPDGTRVEEDDSGFRRVSYPDGGWDEDFPPPPPLPGEEWRKFRKELAEKIRKNFSATRPRNWWNF